MALCATAPLEAMPLRPALADKMRSCNRPPANWTERELRCVVWVRFAPSGQYRNALRIVDCETGYTWDRFTVSRTDDHGLFQINRRWNSDPWKAGDNIYDPVVNTAWAHYYWRTRGWGDWTCARLMGIPT